MATERFDGLERSTTIPFDGILLPGALRKIQRSCFLRIFETSEILSDQLIKLLLKWSKNCVKEI